MCIRDRDKLLFLCEEFVRFKTTYIEDSINGQFSIVKWKLFSEQVNGGLSECCEATVDGVPYSSLNSGMRINAGIDVISALSAFYGVRVPLVVDNAETDVYKRQLLCYGLHLEQGVYPLAIASSRDVSMAELLK